MIHIKSQVEIDKIKSSCRITSDVIKYVGEKIKPGISTLELDEQAESFIKKQNAQPAFKGYRGYPATLCISINEEVVHGIPKKNRILNIGDIVSIDVGVKKNEYFGDMAYTFNVGNISDEKKRLVEKTHDALYQGINEFRIGNRLYSISNAIQVYAEKHGYSIVKEYVGHGIGKDLHEDPQIPNYGKKNTGPRLKKGMIFAIEPMINLGKAKTVLLKDNWTVITKDRMPSAHFEHTVLLTENGPEILTNG